MNDYDFRTLNDKEFEVLATDLISFRDGRKYERFKAGRDQGVDGRFFQCEGKEVVLQCKHWPASPLEKLISYVARVELPKIELLQPVRYVLVISHSLSRIEKDRIAEMLAPFVISPTDVIGREDLNDLLAVDRETELRHYKLWISSTNVLTYLLNKPIQDRSAFAMQEIKENVHLYVPTANHDDAMAKLEERGTVIITGPAGIGKTTLADYVALHYVTKGFSFVRISEEIREAESVYSEEEHQLFYFDDFLGRNYLEALSGHEGAQVVQFIRRVARDKKKRFILTSRSTILNQGKVLIDVLQTNNLEHNEFEVSFDAFSSMDKAKILYNHLWHSLLERAYIDELYVGRRYYQIITHRNYNPRLIRYITESDRLINCPAEEYWRYSKNLLDNPSKVWENPFEAQHDDFGRALIFLVTLNGRAISQNELSESFSRFIAHIDSKSMHGRRDFLQTLRQLAGSMLARTVVREGEPTINLFNPSIGDFVLHRYAYDVPSLRAGFTSLRSISSLNTLIDLSENNLINGEARKAVLDAILIEARDKNYVGYSSSYVALALVKYTDDMNQLSLVDDKIVDASDFVGHADCPLLFADALQVMRWRFEHHLSSPQQIDSYIGQLCEFSAPPIPDELTQLGALMPLLPEDLRMELWPKIEDLAAAYFAGSVHDEFADEDVFCSASSERDAEKNLSQLVIEKLDSLSIPYSDLIVETVVDAYNISDRMREYYREEPDYDYREGRTFGGSDQDDTIDAIHDLFDRSI